MPLDPVPKPPLSIVIACREPWPAMQRALDALHPQAVALGAEIIVVMIDPSTIAPDAARLYPAVRWLQGGRDDSMFRLRAFALPECRGDLIALTEDHAWVEENWCRAIIDTHAQHPEAVAIGGVVENGATASIIDWAGFFAVNGRFMYPIRTGVSDDISLQSNVAYKRGALPESFPEFGLVTSILHHELREAGGQLIATDRMVVHHAQALTFAGHTAAHFYNGRATAAFHRASGPSIMGLLAYALQPPLRLWRTTTAVLAKKRHKRELLMAIPMMMWLLGCQSAGELLGCSFGPGNSARGVQ